MVRNMGIFINICVAFPQLTKLLRVSECTTKANPGLKIKLQNLREKMHISSILKR